jgi:hypothetical protein
MSLPLSRIFFRVLLVGVVLGSSILIAADNELLVDDSAFPTTIAASSAPATRFTPPWLNQQHHAPGTRCALCAMQKLARQSDAPRKQPPLVNDDEESLFPDYMIRR